MTNDDLDMDDDPPETTMAARALPFVTTVVAFAVGALVGGVIIFFFARGQELVEVSRDLSNEEVEAICAPKVDEAVAEATGEIEASSEKVRTLEGQVAAKEAEIERLESEMVARGAKGAELATALKTARAELSSLEAKLEQALAEKEELIIELYRTEVALEEQTSKTELAKEEGLVFKWRSFVGLAQLQICEKGGRRKMGRCRETVAAALDADVRAAFDHCIRSGQETPSLAEGVKGEDLPPFAQWVDEEQRQTTGWYVRLCDPTLPEAKNFQEVDMDEATEGLE